MYSYFIVNNKIYSFVSIKQKFQFNVCYRLLSRYNNLLKILKNFKIGKCKLYLLLSINRVISLKVMFSCLIEIFQRASIGV